MQAHEFMRLFLVHPHLEVKMFDPQQIDLVECEPELSVDSTGPIIYIGWIDEEG